MMNTIHVPMTKWATKSTALQLKRQAEGLSTQTETQIHCVDWNTESDAASFLFGRLPEHPATKRHILQITSRFLRPPWTDLASGLNWQAFVSGHIVSGHWMARDAALGYWYSVVFMEL